MLLLLADVGAVLLDGSIDSVLRESRILSGEGIVDRVGTRTVSARLCARGWLKARCRTVGQDTLASRYQPLDVGATEFASPRVFQPALQVADPGSGTSITTHLCFHRLADVIDRLFGSPHRLHDDHVGIELWRQHVIDAELIHIDSMLVIVSDD